MTGALIIMVGLTAAIASLLMPWSERAAAKSPLIVGIETNRLYLEGRGELSGQVQVVDLSGDAAFSDTDHHISVPVESSEAIASALMTLKTRLKPFVFVMSFDNGPPRKLTEAEQQLIADTLSKY